jgi:Uncharacterised nucleotidyltransferase
VADLADRHIKLRVVVAANRELDLLTVSGRLFLGLARDDAAIGCIKPSLDWSRLSDLAAKEGMSGILAVQLERLARTYKLKIPVEAFSRALHGTFAANGALFAELLALRSALQKHRIRALLLKGGALMTTAYGGKLGLRPLSDLDLLIREPDLPRIRESLLARGFRSVSRSGTLLTKGSAMFDIHTDLVNASRIRRRALAFRFDADAIWSKAVPLDPGEPTFLILSPAYQFLHLAVHAQKHSFSRLIWFLDLALVSRQLDWEQLLLLAESTGTLRAVAYAATGLERLLGIKIPPGVWVSLPTQNRMEKRFMDTVVARRASEPAGELVVAFSIPSLAGRLGYLFEFTFPRRKVLKEFFPRSSAGWFYVRRIGQIVGLAVSYLKDPMRWRGPVEIPKGASGQAN